MARTKRTLPNSSLVASAARIQSGNVKNYSRLSRTEAWQKQAWMFYHTIGEFRYACDWVGSMLSKAILFATLEEDGSYKKIDKGMPFEFMDALFGDSDGRAEMLRLIGIHLTVVGECVVVGYPDVERNGEVDKWEVVANTEIRRQGTSEDSYYIINDEVIEVDPSHVMMTHIWRSDPQKPQKAISPARAVISILGEISRLTDHVAAQVDSRLAGAGILMMPDSMTFPPPPDVEGKPRQANTAEELMAIIYEAMATSIEDRSDASALVPIVITAPADAIEKVRHLTFWSELDEQAIELRNEAIRRLGLGMDMPPEVLQGTADSNHWSAWQADESAIKTHTEPLLKIITSALASGYLRPLLEQEPAMAGVVIEHYSIKADTSEMRLRPNRSKEALELYDRGALSAEALLRETGFDVDDLMDDKERKTWLLRKMAQGSTTPEQVEAAFKILYDTELTPGTKADGSEPGQEERPTPSLKEHPTRELPDPDKSERRKIARDRGDVPSAKSSLESTSMALAYASEQAVFRALERVGNRMKNKMQGKLDGVSASNYYLTFAVKSSELDFYLTDAWGYNLTSVAERLDLDADELTSALDGYCRGLLVTQTEHDFNRLRKHLEGTVLREKVAA